MTKEEQLLFLCTGLNHNPATANKIQAIVRPGLNWGYFFREAENKGVLSLVYQRLKKIDSLEAFIPNEIWDKFKNRYYINLSYNALLSKELDVILSSFNQAGIPVILLKGIALIHTIYSNAAIRPMSDIDILIRKEDFPRAESKLKELGYLNSFHHPEDFYKDNFIIDVHYTFINAARLKSIKQSHDIDLEKIWQESLPIEINGQKARILSPEHNLMALCLHLVFHHGLAGFMRFLDIAYVIEYYKNRIDWEKFVAGCLKYKIDKPVYYTFFYLKKLLGQEMPEFVLEKLRPKINFLERKVLSLILRGSAILGVRFFFIFFSMQNLSDRLIFLREIIFPSPMALWLDNDFKSLSSLPYRYLLHFKSVLSCNFRLLRELF